MSNQEKTSSLGDLLPKAMAQESPSAPASTATYENIHRGADTEPKQLLRFNATVEQAYNALLFWYRVHVNKRHRTFEDDEYVKSEILEIAKAMTRKVPACGFMLCGSPGNGKTTLAWAFRDLLRQLNAYGHFRYMGDDFKFGVIFMTASEICSLVQDQQEKKFDRLKTVPALFIDDLGEEPKEIVVFGSVRQPIREILLARYNNMNLTVVTTNLTSDELLNHYGWRVMDRLREICYKIVHKGPSYR